MRDADPARHAQLLERAANGDHDAFGDFIDATAAKTYALARALSQRDVDTFVQSCYISAWEDLDRYVSSELSPQAWLLSLVQATARPPCRGTE